MANSNTAGFSVGSTSTALAPRNPTRAALLIQNNSLINPVFVCFGSNNNATVLAGFQIIPGGTLEFGPSVGGPYRVSQGISPGGQVPYGDIAAITAGGTANVVVMEA